MTSSTVPPSPPMSSGANAGPPAGAPVPKQVSASCRGLVAIARWLAAHQDSIAVDHGPEDAGRIGDGRLLALEVLSMIPGAIDFGKDEDAVAEAVDLCRLLLASAGGSPDAPPIPGQVIDGVARLMAAHPADLKPWMRRPAVRQAIARHAGHLEPAQIAWLSKQGHAVDLLSNPTISPDAVPGVENVDLLISGRHQWPHDRVIREAVLAIFNGKCPVRHVRDALSNVPLEAFMDALSPSLMRQATSVISREEFTSLLIVLDKPGVPQDILENVIASGVGLSPFMGDPQNIRLMAAAAAANPYLEDTPLNLHAPESLEIATIVVRNNINQDFVRRIIETLVRGNPYSEEGLDGRPAWLPTSFITAASKGPGVDPGSANLLLNVIIGQIQSLRRRLDAEGQWNAHRSWPSSLDDWKPERIAAEIEVLAQAGAAIIDRHGVALDNVGPGTSTASALRIIANLSREEIPLCMRAAMVRSGALSATSSANLVRRAVNLGVNPDQGRVLANAAASRSQSADLAAGNWLEPFRDANGFVYGARPIDLAGGLLFNKSVDPALIDRAIASICAEDAGPGRPGGLPNQLALALSLVSPDIPPTSVAAWAAPTLQQDDPRQDSEGPAGP